VGITADVRGFCVHSLRATAATNALAHGAESAKNWGLRCRFKLLHVVLHPGIPLLECLPEFIIEHTCAHL